MGLMDLEYLCQGLRCSDVAPCHGQVGPAGVEQRHVRPHAAVAITPRSVKLEAWASCNLRCEGRLSQWKHIPVTMLEYQPFANQMGMESWSTTMFTGQTG